MKDIIMNKAIEKVKEAASGIFNFPQIDSDLTVWFVLEGKDYELDQFNISFGQAVDHKGQPQDEVRGGRIMLTLTEAVPENIYQWAMKSIVKNGIIEFRSKTTSSPLKINFIEAYCVNMERVVDLSGGLNSTLVISPKELNINGVDLDNNWI